MTENQKLKMELLDRFAISDEPKTIETCRQAFRFLTEDETPESKPQSTGRLADGVYFVTPDGPLPHDTVQEAPEGTRGVLIVQGDRRLVVSLHDTNAGEDCTLTTSKDPGKDSWNYAKNCDVAVADWNGIENTEHLKSQGLNPGIALDPGEYIPSMGEMLFIFTHKKAVNEALKKAGADVIDDCWYWTSTENSAASAWRLSLSTGMNGYAKATYTNRVRPVSAFIA